MNAENSTMIIRGRRVIRTRINKGQVRANEGGRRLTKEGESKQGGPRRRVWAEGEGVQGPTREGEGQ